MTTENLFDAFINNDESAIEIFNELMAEKISSAIQDKHEEIAQSMFKSNGNIEEKFSNNEEIEQLAEDPITGALIRKKNK